jgi:hypothetical protein
MKRIVVMGQTGRFGDAWCRHAAARLAGRLDVALVSSPEAVPATPEAGWVATATIGALPGRLLHAADTAIWLQFRPLALTRTWARGLRARLAGSFDTQHLPRLTDVRSSLAHMAWTPHLHRLLSHPALAHLHVFHLRSPDETEFWLRAQEHRLLPRQPPLALPA